MVEKEQFLYEVKQFIRSKEAKRFVTAELEFHLKQSTEALKKQGYTAEEAEVKAVQQMGSPITIGQKLNRLHRPKVDWRLTALFLSFPARRLPLQACEGREPNGEGEMNGGWHKPK
ncbi:permease prefix domain 1-containing protein [Peribacillus butanolivorans]|uniref:permease prefix domain 1-containing protein n=1 Tax=Peribacillus butanolivorans TaxID=421767 RepID=UPI003D2AA4B6